MAKAKPRNGQQTQTTSQQLGSLIKSARDIMRKDKGLNGDLDRLPMLTWIMFLKFLDDLERMREDECFLAGGQIRPAPDGPHRAGWPVRLAGLARRRGWHHGRRADRLREQRGGRAPRRYQRSRALRLS